jgi:hypothetical protein
MMHGNTKLKPGFGLRKIKKKCKAIPLQAWTGPEGSRKVEDPPDFKTVGTLRSPNRQYRRCIIPQAVNTV